MTEQPQNADKPMGIDVKKTCTYGLRAAQMVAVFAVIVGFIWGSGDLLMSFIPEGSPVTPLSVLLMLYGGIGGGVIEGVIRVMNRSKK